MARVMEMGREMERLGELRQLREWRQRDKRKKERRLFLRLYIDATMHLAPIGDAVRICCVSNIQILFCGIFFLFARIA